MMKQSVRRTLITLLILSVIFLAMISTVLIANEIIRGVTDTHPQANTAFDHFSTARHNYIVEWTQLIVLDAQRAALTVSYNSNKSTMYKEALELASDAIPTSWDFGQNIKDTAKNAAKMAISYADKVSLQKALVNKTIEIQKKDVAVASDKSKMDTAYTHYVSHINAYNNSDNTTSNDVDPAAKGKIPTGGGNPSTDLSVDCGNPECSKSYRASVYGLSKIVAMSEEYHKVTCSRDHAYWDGGRKQVKRGASLAPSGPYWSCPPDYPGCPKASNHVKQCPGTCGEYNVYPARGGGNYVNYHAMHRVACNENVPPNIFNGWTGNCPGFYWSCAGVSSCNHASNHISGSQPPTGSTPPSSGGSTPPTDDTPQCPDCTSDCVYPCLCGNSGSCGGTVTTPPADPPPADGCAADCWFEDDECNVTCTKCELPYRICTSQPGDCTLGDGWHTSESSE